MSVIDTNRDLAKVFEGAYKYLSNEQPYSQETFTVFKNYANSNIEFNSTIMTRVANGEFLIVKVFYRFNKDYVPTHLVIDKTLGSQNIKEIFLVDFKEQMLNYSFIAEGIEKKCQLSLPPKFYFASPSACTSFIYFLTKKFDNNGTNFYSVISSNNIWEYSSEPVSNRILVEAPVKQINEIKVNKMTLSCSQYLVFNESDEYQSKATTVYVSKHYAIPYRITGGKNLKIEIEFLKNLEQDRVDLL